MSTTEDLDDPRGALDRETVERLLDAELPRDQLRDEILPGPKDPGRFETVREILQDRLEWEDPILMPLNDHLHVVGTSEGRVIRGECGHDFCGADENWKLACRVRLQEDQDELSRYYPAEQTFNPDWDFQLREFICPECLTLITVDAVPAGYPMRKPFEPDIDTFYEEWLGKPAPDKE